MAYMSQEKKKDIAAALKGVVPAGWKYSLGVRHHSTICMTIASAPVDLLGEMQACRNREAARRGDDAYEIMGDAQVNDRCPAEKQFLESAEVMQKIMDALNLNNHDNSDSQTDYFDVGHYIDLRIGKWDKPFVVALKSA